MDFVNLTLATGLGWIQLVVRIFRTDRTTKAILIEENMTAGEVASMMIEKNFLQPSIRLAVVEKVPALKVGKSEIQLEFPLTLWSCLFELILSIIHLLTCK